MAEASPGVTSANEPRDLAAQARGAALIGAGAWTLFLAFIVLAHALGLMHFPQLARMAAVFAAAIGVNLLLAVTTHRWIRWRVSVYGYEALNAVFVTLVLAYAGGSVQLGIVFVTYGFFVVHGGAMRSDASPFVTASICGMAYATLAATEAAGWLTPTPVLHDPVRAGERVVFVAFGLIALNYLALYAQRMRTLATSNATLSAKARALEANRQELEQFVYRVTHDLKTPVNNVLLFSDRLLDPEYALGEAARTRVERIRQIAEHAENMIADLWDFVQITSQPEHLTWCDLTALVAPALQTLQAQIEAKGARVTIVGAAPIWGRSKKLGHVVANLLGNAVRYVPDDRGEIDLLAVAEGVETRITVRDNGIGIPEEYHRHIFELYGRAPEAGRGGVPQGTGVGLAIVKRIVEEHGGTVWVESSPGSGSCFVIRLPRPDTGRARSEPVL